jgi:hypothetical protein
MRGDTRNRALGLAPVRATPRFRAAKIRTIVDQIVSELRRLNNLGERFDAFEKATRREKSAMMRRHLEARFSTHSTCC